VRQLVDDHVSDGHRVADAADLELLRLRVVEADHAAGKQLLDGVLGVDARRQQAQRLQDLGLARQVGLVHPLQLHHPGAEGLVGEVADGHPVLELEAPVRLDEPHRLRHEGVDGVGRRRRGARRERAAGQRAGGEQDRQRQDAGHQPPAAQGCMPSRIHCLNFSTCSSGHAPSHGIEPDSSRSTMAAALSLTSS
jgi:hypothetical protein